MGKIVGILSMQKVLNYGSFLQAYALKQLLLQNGADEVYFLDIEKGRLLPKYMFPKVSITAKIKRTIVLFLNGKLLLKLRDRRFSKILTTSIGKQIQLLDLDKPTPSHFDIVFIGSDEVFNCCQPSTWGYSPQLYGAIPIADRVVSYAGSFGHTTYEQLLEENLTEEIGRTMKENLSSISVRDQNSYDIVERLTGIKPEIHLDPVLIYGYKDIVSNDESMSQKPYMIVYSYRERISDKREINEIVSFAKSNKLRLISIFCRYDWCDEAIVPKTPFDVLRWFKGANYIVTDTFHGTIFSIITHRPFCVLFRETNIQKIGALLGQLSLSEKGIFCKDIKNMEAILCNHIDYEKVEGILQQERAKSVNYIKSQLNNIF